MSAAAPIAVHHLIGGEWTGEPERTRENPARPGEVVAELPTGGAGEVEAALTAARAAFPGWRKTPAPARGAILARAAELLAARKDEVARDLVAEEGKTIAEATGEVQRAADILRYFGGEGWRIGGQSLPSSVPSTHLYTVKEPLGVVALITPWNFPIAIPTWKLAPALVAGNAVVMKPAALVPVSAQHLAECLVEAGLPAGVLNVVHGSGAVVGRRSRARRARRRRQLHGLGEDRTRRERDRERAPGAGPARDGWQERRRRARGRRPRGRGADRGRRAASASPGRRARRPRA